VVENPFILDDALIGNHSDTDHSKSVGQTSALNGHTSSNCVDKMLIDAHGRRITDLRISVTDRCNLRCGYCVPAGDLRFAKREQLLDFDEIVRLVEVAASLGIKKFRLTGGEPLVRCGLPALVARLARLPDVEDVPITTNGVLLAEQASALYAAGARRLNISLDALSQDCVQSMTRRDVLNQVLAGIQVAYETGFHIKINMIPIRGVNEEQIIPMAHWAIDRGLHLRYIEYMPFASNGWSLNQVITATELRSRLSRELGLGEGRRAQPESPAVDYPVPGTDVPLGIIACVTEPFCRHCSRMRLTPDGMLRPCLHSDVELDIIGLLRSGTDTHSLQAVFRAAAAAKPQGRHQFHSEVQPMEVAARPMIRMGG
jgi:cyclic pyranopterin phosphate synthase